MTNAADLLVVGAGPTGLVTALQAQALCSRVRLVERRSERFRPSRAMLVHPRTLECLRPLGVVDDLLTRSRTAFGAELHLGRRCVHVPLAEIELRDASYPHLTMIRQADVEEVLAQALEARGVGVERGVELVDAESDEQGVTAALRSGASDCESVRCRFVAGCDGPDSTVRRLAGIGWRGDAYREEVILADVELEGNLVPGELHVGAGHQGLAFLFPLGERATWRLLGTSSAAGTTSAFGQPGAAVPQQDVQRVLDEAGLNVRIRELPWSASVRLQHRLADSFRSGPFFLAGDAAHAHSPAAAQGMNTGILDAVNLGWKLAFASRDGVDGPTQLLASYESERRPVARQVLALTHAVFVAEASTQPLPSLLRAQILPLLAPALPVVLQRRRVIAAVVRLLSQDWVRYRRSSLSVDGTPAGHGPRPGDRLPDEEVTCDGRRIRMHELTATPGVHLLLDRGARAVDANSLGGGVHVHVIDSRTGHGLVAIRPDGYVGFRCATTDPEQLRAWLHLIRAVR